MFNIVFGYRFFSNVIKILFKFLFVVSLKLLFPMEIYRLTRGANLVLGEIFF